LIVEFVTCPKPLKIVGWFEIYRDSIIVPYFRHIVYTINLQKY